MGNKDDSTNGFGSNKENNEKLKRARAEDFFGSDLSKIKKSKSSKVKSPQPKSKKERDENRSRGSPDRKEKSHGHRADNSLYKSKKRYEDDKQVRKNRESDKLDKKPRRDSSGDSDKHESKSSRKYTSEKSRRSPKRRNVSPLYDYKSSKSERYWGGEHNIPDPVFENDRKNRNYNIGSRYYDENPKVQELEKIDDSCKEKYLVGSRYYEDKPTKNMKEKNTFNAQGVKETKQSNEVVQPPKPKKDDIFTSRTGGAYIPPAKLRMMQANITDKSSIAYQRIAWEALKKSIHGHINKVNTSNIGIIARLLMKENIIRGRGLLCRSILQAQAASTTFTNVYASLVNVINSKFPNIGELLLKRVILQFKRGFKRNDKPLCIASCQFIAHLVNQQVAHEIIALEMLTLLLETPTDDSVEVAVAFLKECGQKLLEVSPKGCNAIFDMLRNILHEGNLEKRVQYMIEVVFQVRKDEFRSFPSIAENLDLVEEEDQYTHILTLDEAADAEDLLNVFKHDGDYELNEDKYKALKEEIIGESSSEGESGDEEEGSGDSEADSSGDENQPKDSGGMMIVDNTETNLVALRRTIYLTIQSSLDFEECCHKLLKMEIKPGQESEVCNMLLDCCAELRSYEKFFGLLAQRFCRINRIYIAPLEDMFKSSYATVHRLDTNKLRNVARFFAHLLYTDAISWQVLECIKLNEEDTTSSSRIFIKILFQELSEYMGLANLNQRLKDPTFQLAMEGLFPRDNPKNTRFAINFFTSIGLGGLTDELREHLKSQPKPSTVPQLVEQLSSDSSSSSESSSDSSSSESSSDSESEKERKKKSSKNKDMKKGPSKKSSEQKKNTSKKEKYKNKR